MTAQRRKRNCSMTAQKRKRNCSMTAQKRMHGKFAALLLVFVLLFSLLPIGTAAADTVVSNEETVTVTFNFTFDGRTLTENVPLHVTSGSAIGIEILEEKLLLEPDHPLWSLFEGWFIYHEATGYELFTHDFVVTENITVFARWGGERLGYWVDFKLDGGIHADGFYLLYWLLAEPELTIYNPNKENHTFLGWKVVYEDGKYLYINKTPSVSYIVLDLEYRGITGNITFEAMWEQSVEERPPQFFLIVTHEEPRAEIPAPPTPPPYIPWTPRTGTAAVHEVESTDEDESPVDIELVTELPADYETIPEQPAAELPITIPVPPMPTTEPPTIGWVATEEPAEQLPAVQPPQQERPPAPQTGDLRGTAPFVALLFTGLGLMGAAFIFLVKRIKVKG